MLIPVLLSGGVGSRLWPVSREAHPKQFLPLASEASMLQDTLARTQGLDAAAPVVGKFFFRSSIRKVCFLYE